MATQSHPVKHTDLLNLAVGSSRYVAGWSFDFLRDSLGRNGVCDRYYHEQKLAVDIGDPDSDINIRKQQLFNKHGFQYICIPEYSTSADLNRLLIFSKHGNLPVC